jgi:hypothetical protein
LGKSLEAYRNINCTAGFYFVVSVAICVNRYGYFLDNKGLFTMKYILVVCAALFMSCAGVEKPAEPYPINLCSSAPKSTDNVQLVECKATATKCTCFYTSTINGLTCVIEISSTSGGPWDVSGGMCQ